MTPEEIFSRIEEIAVRANINYIDATIHFCSVSGLEIESVAELIKRNPKLRSKVKNLASSMRLLKGGRKLPI